MYTELESKSTFSQRLLSLLNNFATVYTLIVYVVSRNGIDFGCLASALNSTRFNERVKFICALISPKVESVIVLRRSRLCLTARDAGILEIIARFAATFPIQFLINVQNERVNKLRSRYTYEHTSKNHRRFLQLITFSGHGCNASAFVC